MSKRCRNIESSYCLREGREKEGTHCWVSERGWKSTVHEWLGVKGVLSKISVNGGYILPARLVVREDYSSR